MSFLWQCCCPFCFNSLQTLAWLKLAVYMLMENKFKLMLTRLSVLLLAHSAYHSESDIKRVRCCMLEEGNLAAKAPHGTQAQKWLNPQGEGPTTSFILNAIHANAGPHCVRTDGEQPSDSAASHQSNWHQPCLLFPFFNVLLCFTEKVLRGLAVGPGKKKVKNEWKILGVRQVSTSN